MANLMSDILSSVNELKTTNIWLLDHVNKLNVQDCSCNRSKDQLQKETSELQTKCDELISKERDLDKRQLQLSDDAKGLMYRLDCIERLLLSKQTDDSKIQRVASRRKNTTNSPIEREFHTSNSEASGITVKLLTQKERKDSEEENDAKVDEETSEYQRKSTHHPIEKDKTIQLHGLVSRPNFLKTQIPTVKQEERLMLDGENFWRSAAQNELEISRSQFSQLQGVHSILCLDISESMSEGNAWLQAQTFLTDYLLGLEEMSKLPHLNKEHVALITFGHETKTQMKYTDRYNEVQKVIDNLKVGGPSQMYGGILYALAAAWCSVHQIEKLENSVLLFTKIIMITDGKPTETDLIAGPDRSDSSKVDETKAKILQEMEHYRKNNFDLFFVPVGFFDMSYIETMVACSEGVMLNYKSGRRLARRQFLSAKLLDPLGLAAYLTLDEEDLSSEDKEDLRSIQERGKCHFAKHQKVDENIYGETSAYELPSVGSRVRRGPDWTYNMQDSDGPGTVIGHSDDSPHIWVEWDADENKNVYSYSNLGYDVLIVDEPRVLQPGQLIAVGSEVKPGTAWRSSGEKPKHGVVIRLDKRNKKALVRWNNGRRGSYSYGDGGPQEIEIKNLSQFRERGENIQSQRQKIWENVENTSTKLNKNKK